jgi:hypothetical protein
MSGVGKSYWTQKLAASGFRAISIDDRIEEKLAPELNAGCCRGIGGRRLGGGLPEGVNRKDVFPLHEFLQDCFQFIECFRPAHFFFLFL